MTACTFAVDTPGPVQVRTAAGTPRDGIGPTDAFHGRFASHNDIPAPYATAPEGATVLRFAGPERNWVVAVALCSAPDGYDTSRHAYVRPFHLIEWHLAAANVRRVLPSGQAIETLRASDFIVHPARSRLLFIANGPSRFVRYFIEDDFVRAAATDLAGDRASGAHLLSCDRFMRNDPMVATMLDAYFRRAFDEFDAPTKLEMDSRASLIVLELLRRHSTLAERTRRTRTGGLAPHHLKRVCDAMTHDLAQEMPLAKLAAMVGFSYHHFCHAFKASVGLAPHQWLVERRVERACDLLRSTRQSVTDIAAAVGYDDPNQLLRVFRARRGTTPAGYRRELQVKSAAHESVASDAPFVS
jgi:AraC family transcriptional regulator